MTATNHVVSGALIGAVISSPVALPLALASHFLLDSIPHFGDIPHNSRKFLYILSADMALALSVLISLLILQPSSAVLMIACGVLAASPDLMWLPRWLNELRGKKNKPKNKLMRFHSVIQKESRRGMVIELAMLLVSGYLLLLSIKP